MATRKSIRSRGPSEVRLVAIGCSLLLTIVAATWVSCSDSEAPPGAPSEATPKSDADAPPPPRGAPTEDAALPEDADASEDENPFPGAWSTVPGTPADCKLRIADHPATLASKWVACPSGRAGCRQLDTSWTRHVGWTLNTQAQTDSIRLVAGVPYFKIRRNWPPKDPTKGRYVAYVIEPLDGAPVLAVGAAAFPYKDTTRWCSIRGTFGDYGIGYAAVPRDPALPLSERGSDVNVFGWASWAAPTLFKTKAWSPGEIGAPGALLSSMTMGDRGFWLDGEGPLTTYGFDVTTESGLLAENRHHTEGPIGIPGGALVFDAIAPYAIATLKNDGSLVRLVTPTGTQFVTWKTLDRSADNTLVWVESDDGFEYRNATLWTAPLAATEASLVRRKVAKLDDSLFRGGGRSPANKGMFLSLTGRNTAVLTRLSDGVGWRIQAEPNERFVDAVWVDDNDVFLETAKDDGSQFQHPPSGLMRLSRATLGAPTVPSGL